jgi:hypothetical protein
MNQRAQELHLAGAHWYATGTQRTAGPRFSARPPQTRAGEDFIRRLVYELEAVIFGGHGRKVKTRGEVFFPCTDCAALNTFALVENYGYGQLYGVRLAKFKTNRYLVCAHCRDGYGLDKEQWDQALIIARGLKALVGTNSA